MTVLFGAQCGAGITCFLFSSQYSPPSTDNVVANRKLSVCDRKRGQLST